MKEQANVIDRVVAFFSPEAGYRRMLFRQGYAALSGYDAAKRDRLQPWAGSNGPAESVAGAARELLRGRARDLEINSEMAEAAVGALIRNVVGTGIRPQAQVKLRSGEFDERTNQALEAAWARWVKHMNCDISRRAGFYEFQRIMLRRRIIDGEALCRMVIARDARVPLALQGLESDALASYIYKAPGGNYIVAGVEVDAYFAPVAYWIQPASPDGLTFSNPERFPAEDMIHLYQLDRWTQVRGVSELARIMRRLRETGEYLDAEVIAAKISACFALLITRQSPAGAIGRAAIDTDGKRLETIEPGMIQYLQPGEDVRTATPNRTASAVKDFIQVEQRLAAAGMGQSYEVVSRDMSQSNYSSARQNNLEDRKTWEPMQQYLVDHFCQPVWERFVEACVLGGAVNLPAYWSDPERYHACRWVAPGWTWIDPLKEVQGKKEELRGGLTTLQQITAEQGQDWREVLEQIAREKQFANELGLELDIYRPAAPAKGDGGNGGEGETGNGAGKA